MARLDLPDKWRDEDDAKPEIGSENWHRANGPEEHDSVDSPVTSGALRADKRSLTEPKRRYCYLQCRDPFFNECADCWRSGGNPSLG